MQIRFGAVDFTSVRKVKTGLGLEGFRASGTIEGMGPYEAEVARSNAGHGMFLSSINFKDCDLKADVLSGDSLTILNDRNLLDVGLSAKETAAIRNEALALERAYFTQVWEKED